MQYIIQDRQSLLDIACISGDVENMFDIAIANELSTDATLESGDKIIYQGNELAISPATSLEYESSLGGINYMGVEIDFIIS